MSTNMVTNARNMLAVYYLAKYDDPKTAADALFADRICGDVQTTSQLLTIMQNELNTPSNELNNCYLHVTYGCNLACAHCFADADPTREMSPEHFEYAIKSAIDLRFRDIRITGGEPTVHHGFWDLLAICREYRGKGTQLVLRTNFYKEFSENELRTMAQAVDSILVSIDGDERTHDERRGVGAYARTIRNMEQYQACTRLIPDAATLSISCVKSYASETPEIDQSVRALVDRLQLESVRFKPLFPLGRSSERNEPMISGGQLTQLSAEALIARAVFPIKTCGIGINFYIEPDGATYPCVACRHSNSYIGNVFESGFAELAQSEKFALIRSRTVNTIERCQSCEYRYLCGGACRAWDDQVELDLNAAPAPCDHLKEQAQKLVDTARHLVLCH